MKNMNYSEFTEKLRIFTISENIELTLTEDDAKFTYLSYTNFNLSFIDAIDLTLDQKLEETEDTATIRLIRTIKRKLR